MQPEPILEQAKKAAYTGAFAASAKELLTAEGLRAFCEDRLPKSTLNVVLAHTQSVAIRFDGATAPFTEVH